MNKQSRLARKLTAYFAGLKGYTPGTRVQLSQDWAGVPAGRTGVIVNRRITLVFGRRMNIIVPAVQFDNDGSCEWGMHMAEKVKVLNA